ncbi:MAG: hypothetical protein FWF76_03905 [Oscillospiraceae bacterium]|nr:hypothetical protein [Oscillospiraceae bacterium]
MLFLETSRYWKSKLNIVIIIASLFVIVLATLQNYSSKMEFERALNFALSNPRTTVEDIEFLTTMTEQFTGVFYFERLFFLNVDYYVVFWVITMIGMGIHIGARAFSNLQSSYGTLLVTRISYVNYLNKTLLAQIIYMLTFMILMFLIMFVGLVIFGGGGLQVPEASRTGGILLDNATPMPRTTYFLTLIGIVFYSIACMIPLVIISTLSYVLFKNKYIIKFIPFAVMVGCYILAFVFGNLNSEMGLIMRMFIFESSITSLTGMISPYVGFEGSNYLSLFYVIVYPVGLWAISFILYLTNVRKFGRNYL